MQEVYSNNIVNKSSIQSYSHSPTKKTVMFTPMQQSVIHSHFSLNDQSDGNQSSEDNHFYSQGLKKPKKYSHSRKHHSMLDVSKKLLKSDKAEQQHKNKHDVYDDLIQLLSHKLKLENTPMTLHPRKGSKSCKALNQYKQAVRSDIIDTSSLTNTELISDFYEYTNNCMQMILQLKAIKELGTGVDLGIDTCIKKRIAVFDLDETIIHCVGTITMNNSGKTYHHQLTVNLPLKQTVQIGLNVRPNWKKALKMIMPKYHIVVYTASQQAYSDAVLNFLDPKNKYFKHRLYRHHCISEMINDHKFYIKDLRIFKNIDLKDIVIIDNSILSFAYQISNGIPILPYYDAEKDVELACLSYYLLSIDSEFEDLRAANNKIIQLGEIVSNAQKELEQENVTTENESIDEEEGKSSQSSQNTNKYLISPELRIKFRSLKEHYLELSRAHEI